MKKKYFFHIYILITFVIKSNLLFANNNFYLSAEKISKNNKNQIITAEGEVNIISRDTKLKANKITYDISLQEVYAIGNVVINYKNGNIIYADEAKLESSLKSGFIKNIGVLLSNDSRIAASSANNVIKKNKTVYNNIVFTSCKSCKKADKENILWKLKAKKATHLKNSKIILYENVFLEIFDIPVVYVPLFYHPDPTVESKTGLLTPKISNSNTFGRVYEQPIFFNLSSKSNLALNTKLSSKEGPHIATDYKKISPSSKLDFKSSLTEGSKVRLNEPTKKEVRGHIDFQYFNKVNSNWLFGTNIKKSSDKSYLTKYGLSEGESILNQNIFLESGSVYKNFSLDMYKFQSLSDEYDSAKLPFIRPVIVANWNNLYDKDRDRNYENSVTFNSISRRNGQNVDSMHFQTTSDKKYIYNGLLMKNLTQLNFDLYSNKGTNNNKNTYKFFPQVGIDFSYPLLSHTKDSALLLKPRVQFFFSPDDFKNDIIRNEDSLDVDLSSSNIFDINRYSGLDRIESGIRVNYGLSFKKNINNGNSFSGVLGRVYNNNKQQLFNVDSGLEKKNSEIVGDLAFKHKIYQLKYDYRVGEDLEINRNSIEAVTGFNSFNINLSYIQLRNFASSKNNDTEQVSYGFSKKVFNNWQFRGSQLRDLAGADYSTPIRSDLGIIFSNDCALLQIAYVRDKSYDVDIPTVTNLSFTIKLFGF